ncbi:MAG: response regulator [Anaerolineales bacterium]|nr:response regulator [Anaerolineales bacterium]
MPHILVVDNQRETSKAIRAGLQSLGQEFVVATALSGEEALLEARLQKFDLLISEVRLPGMSGVELVQKLRASKSDLKVILVSATLDRYIRREVTGIGVDNLLQKPLEISELLQEVKQILALGEQKQEKPENSEPLSISDRLANLRQEVNAALALLMSDTGEILMQAGDHRHLGLDAEISSLTAVFGAGYKISRLLGAVTPDNFYTFKGNKLDLIMTHVGDAHALLVGVSTSDTHQTKIDSLYEIIHQGTHDLQAILMDMGVDVVIHPEPEPEIPPPVNVLDEAEIVQTTFEADADLEALFAKADKASSGTDLDTFWEVETVEDTGIFMSADALSYEQARQLGLAPESEK